MNHWSKPQQWVVGAIILGYMLFYFPFVFRYFLPLPYQFFVVLAGIAGILMALWVLLLQKRPRLVVLAVVVIIAKLGFMTIGTIASGRGLMAMMPEYLRYFAVIGLICAMTPAIFIKIDGLARSIVVLLSFLAVLGLFLAATGMDLWIGEIELDSSGGGLDSGLRGYSYFGLYWMKLQFFGDQIYRLQSFASEAGNFATAVSCALFYYFSGQGGRKFSTIVAILILALALTLSLSAFLSMFTVLLIRFFFVRGKRVDFIVTLALSALLFMFANYFYSDFIGEYLNTKFVESDVGDSSVAQRVSQLYFFIDKISECGLAGCGTNSAALFNNTLAVGWLIPFLNCGPIFGFLYAIFFLKLFIDSFKAIQSGIPLYEYAGMVYMFLFLQGFFRGEPFSSAWYFLFVVPMLYGAYYFKERGEDGKSG